MLSSPDNSEGVMISFPCDPCLLHELMSHVRFGISKPLGTISNKFSVSISKTSLKMQTEQEIFQRAKATELPYKTQQK